MARGKRRTVDPGHSAYDRLRIPRDGDRRSKQMPTTIPKWVRDQDGVTDPLDGCRKRLKSSEWNQSDSGVWNKTIGSPSWTRFGLWCCRRPR